MRAWLLKVGCTWLSRVCRCAGFNIQCRHRQKHFHVAHLGHTTHAKERELATGSLLHRALKMRQGPLEAGGHKESTAWGIGDASGVRWGCVGHIGCVTGFGGATGAGAVSGCSQNGCWVLPILPGVVIGSATVCAERCGDVVEWWEGEGERARRRMRRVQKCSGCH